MSGEGLLAQLEGYAPWNEQEARDKAVLLTMLRSGRDLWTRENETAHLTASAWVTDPTRTRVLMCYHNIYHSWSWLGGHADGDRDLLGVALREVGEESGLASVRPVSEDLFSLEILTVDGHEKRGRYVPSHLHLNVTYLLTAEESDPLRPRAGENTKVAWLPADRLLELTNEWEMDEVYTKLLARARALV